MQKKPLKKHKEMGRKNKIPQRGGQSRMKEKQEKKHGEEPNEKRLQKWDKQSNSDLVRRGVVVLLRSPEGHLECRCDVTIN